MISQFRYHRFGNRSLCHRLAGAGVNLVCDDIAAGLIHTGDEVSGASFADHRVAFPIAEPGTFVGLLRRWAWFV